MPRLQRLALPAILVVAGVNYLLGLGSSSYYVDEILGVGVANQPFGSMLTVIGHQEISPPGWFVLLHEVGAHLGSSRTEWLMRLPSAICAVALVAVVFWLVRLLGVGRGPALVAAGICALSPFLIEYAQRAQGYAAAALGVALAVAAAIDAEMSPAGSARRRRSFGLSLLAALAALLCNYTSLLIIAPLCGWLIVRRTLPGRWAWGYTAACAAVQIALAPLLVTQHGAHPERGVGASAVLNGSTLQNMLELPFGGRVAPLRLVGVFVRRAARGGAVPAARRRRPAGGWPRSFDGRRLVLVLAIGEPVVLIVLSGLGGHFFGLLMLNRYGAVAVPFLIAAIVLALVGLPRTLAAVLVVAAAVVLVTGTIANHRAGSNYLDARGVASYVRAHAAPGDVVLEPPYPYYSLPLAYYGLPRAVYSTPPVLGSLLLRHTHRLWLLSAVPAGAAHHRATLLSLTGLGLRRFGYRPVAARVFPSTAPIASVLVAPTGSSR